MARLQPLPIEHTPALGDRFAFFVGTLGFVPNSVLTMQRKPQLVKALAALQARERGESETQIVELLGVIALFGFLNRWNKDLLQL